MKTAPLNPTVGARAVRALACLLAAWLLVCWAPAANAQTSGALGTSPETALPVYAVQNVAPLVMLTMARDHSLSYQAYNYTSYLYGDGKLDNVFNPNIEYIGLFNPYYCYYPTDTGWGNNYTTRKNRARFSYWQPQARTALRTDPDGRTVPGGCPYYISGNYTSGNWLNWATTTRMDALRVALYGGQRHLDQDGNTILRRAFLPQDNHSWGLTYQGAATTDRYYGTEVPPYGNNKISFMNLSPQERFFYNQGLYSFESLMCWRLILCVENRPPVMWDDLYTQALDPINLAWRGPVALPDDTYTIGPGKPMMEKYMLVQVCVPPWIDRCKAYTKPDGTVSYKPVGILQNYGETGKIKFGLITGSYDSNLSGGILRKNISSFSDEIDPNTGIFKTPAVDAAAGLIIDQINNLAIRNFNNYKGDTANPDVGTQAWAYKYKNGFTYTRTMMNEGNYGDWGNPIGEMMYEGLRYLKGESAPVFDGTITSQADPTALGDDYTKTYGVGLRTPAWVDPYSKKNVCAKPNLLVISGPNSFDSDQLPGAYFSKDRGGQQTIPALTSVSGASLDVTSLANTIGTDESISGTRLIGEAPGNKDYAPTAKSVSALGQIRGLAPDGANSEGSYYAASVAKFGREQRLRSIDNINIPTVDTYTLQFAHDAPVIKVPVNGKIITIIPFGKTLDPNNAANNAKGQFQATNQIMAARADTLSDPLNASNSFSLVLAVNFDDASWGGIHMMHAVVYYTITADATQVTVSARVDRSANGSTQNLGYIVSGSTNDGVYLVATNASTATKYFLNVPDGQYANYCLNNVDLAGCDTIATFGQQSSTKTFTPSASPAGKLLKDPLWYAAKWGGYAEGAKPTGPTNSDPETFADLTNPAKLYTALPAMLDTMLNRRSTVVSAMSNAQQSQGAGKLFTTSYDLSDFSGVLTATPYAVSQGASAEVVNYSGGWNTTSSLTDASTRNIYYKSKIGSSLSPFSYGNLNSDYNGRFDSNFRVQYLRGDTSRERRNGGTYRNRSKTLGMTVNSVPVYSADTGAVYVAANDGMLHAFNASDGIEKFAYVPTTAINSTNNLSLLADTAYTHRYFLDGNIAISNKADTGGVNYLVGFMGRAAKGLFGLQVTAAGVNTSSGTWENFGVNDLNMGYLLGQPVITKLSDNTPVVVFGNGYNSSNNMAVLYVARLSDGVVLAKFSSNSGSAAAPNGLATPGLVTNSNGQVQYAYAGDYLGNVWKFNLTTLTNAGMASPPAASRVFTTADPSNKAQPITVAITPSVSSTSADSVVVNKQFLFFGTGSDLTTDDVGSFQTQSMYGLIDAGAGASILKANLVQRTIDASGTASGRVVRSFSQPSTVPANDMTNRSGWYMNWSASGTSASEKVFGTAVVRTGAVPSLVISSNIVDSASCVSSNSGYLNIMDAYHGGGLVESYVDLNRNGSFADETFNNNGAKVISSVDFGIGVLGQASFSGNNVLLHGSAVNATTGSDRADAATKSFNNRKLRRISWREIVK